MNNCKIYLELMNVKAYLRAIEDNADYVDRVDIVTRAQYGIQDTMAKIIDELLEFVSSRCYQRSRDTESIITDEVHSSYVEGEDKTLVWHTVYVNGDIVTEELAGWYHGEPNDKMTKDFCSPSLTAYYI